MSSLPRLAEMIISKGLFSLWSLGNPGCGEVGGEESVRQRHRVSPLSVWSLVSAAATRCQATRMWGTDGGRARWRCPRPLSSSRSEHPLPAGWAQLRRKRREAEPCQIRLLLPWQRQTGKIEAGRRSERYDPESQSVTDGGRDLRPTLKTVALTKTHFSLPLSSSDIQSHLWAAVVDVVIISLALTRHKLLTDINNNSRIIQDSNKKSKVLKAAGVDAFHTQHRWWRRLRVYSNSQILNSLFFFFCFIWAHSSSENRPWRPRATVKIGVKKSSSVIISVCVCA